MSLPLYACTIIKAVKGDAKAKETLIARLDQPAFTYHPCTCKPKCEQPTTAQTGDFFIALDKTHPQTVIKLLNLAQQ